jgi:hypothetical protein
MSASEVEMLAAVEGTPVQPATTPHTIAMATSDVARTGREGDWRIVMIPEGSQELRIDVAG